MPSLYRATTLATPLARAMSVAALLGATLLAVPLSAAHAASADTAPLRLAQTTAPTQPTAPTQSPATSPTPSSAAATPAPQAAPQTQGSDTTAETKPETVEQRITSLHAALEITPQEDSKWDRVAEVMRSNAATMQKLIDQRDAQAGNITAVQDLQEYEKFAEAHLTGLRKLTASFDALYHSMPAAQQKLADQVFENFGHHKTASAHS